MARPSRGERRSPTLSDGNFVEMMFRAVSRTNVSPLLSSLRTLSLQTVWRATLSSDFIVFPRDICCVACYAPFVCHPSRHLLKSRRNRSIECAPPSSNAYKVHFLHVCVHIRWIASLREGAPFPGHCRRQQL
ncbi:hypothetical protein QQG55_7710 [Brugia pahangi]